MKISSLLIAALLTTSVLAACDRPTVVNTPPATTVAVPVPVPVPGPAGPQGEAGKSGATGEAGKPGATNIVVVPAPAMAASEPK